jgi:hypothetical protein
MKKMYRSYSEDDAILCMLYGEFVEFCTGKLILSIGRGDFKETLGRIIEMAMSWGIKNDDDTQAYRSKR